MSRSVCFRCDWEGDTRAVSCPSCGAPLHRPQATAIRAPERRPAARPSERESAARPSAPLAAGPLRLLLVTASVTVALAVLWAGIPRVTPAPAPGALARPTRPAVLEGILVYAADVAGTPGRQVLWTLDLTTGIARRGPGVPRVDRLLDASGAGRGWVGLTVNGPRGFARAYVLRGTSREDRPVWLGAGDLVSWGPGGREVVLARMGASRGGCRRSTKIDLIQVETLHRERVLDEPNLCGRLLSLGRDGAQTYFTLARNDAVGVYYAGIGVLHRLLRGYAMRSVSQASDFLVTPIAGVDRPRSRAGAVEGTALFWPGTGGPVAFGTGTHELVVDRALAWSGDASQAAVAGRLGGRRGVYLLDAGPGSTTRRPRFVLASGPDVDATFSADGTAYLVIHGRLFGYANGTPIRVALPAGAPTPAGPITWLP